MHTGDSSTQGRRQAERWFPVRDPECSGAARLFCFPYAGGGAHIFREWQEAFAPSSGVKVYPVQYPGRAARMREPAFADCRALVEALAPVILPLTDKPFAFFGHSMGAIVAFELARALRRSYGRAPQCLFVSGRRAPHLPARNPSVHELPDAEFIDELRRLEGTPPEVLAHPELMELLLPTIRADFALTQAYRYTDEPPLDCPVNAFGGTEDVDVELWQLRAWCEHTTGACSHEMFTGNHFFLHTARESLWRSIARAWPPPARHG